MLEQTGVFVTDGHRLGIALAEAFLTPAGREEPVITRWTIGPAKEKGSERPILGSTVLTMERDGVTRVVVLDMPPGGNRVSPRMRSQNA